MSIDSHADLLNYLLEATKPSEAQSILEEIGDRAELSVDEPFGDKGYLWHFYGDRESNMSTVNLGSKAGRSLTERVTNAIDAVLEKQMAQRGGTQPPSPMDAAKLWFGRPPTSYSSGLFDWNFSTYDYDKLIQIVMTSGDIVSAPTIDVADAGIGITPDNFSNTILSLQRGNKIKKHYLTGAWGQGGAATLAFCDYVLVVSRSIDSPEIVGFTIIKLMKLEETYKENAYVYLAVQNEDGKLTVPSCFSKDMVNRYPGIQQQAIRPVDSISGTLVRHFGYHLEGLEKTLAPSPGNLYHLFQDMLFDPLLPFRVIDLRKAGAFKNELITGSRNRLMKLSTSSQTDQEVDEGSETETSGSTLRHFRRREMVSPRSDVPPSVGIEYWVILSRKKSGNKIVPRSSSSELYVEKNHPILATFNGQNQGEVTAKILKDLRLPMVARHIVIHIDASQAARDIRSSLFTSTRESFKDGEVLTELTRILTNMLQEDDALYEIERELEENLLRKETIEVDQEVRRQITGLLRDSGFQVKEPGEILVAGSNGNVATAPLRPGHKPGKAEPLKTLLYPDVTRFEIVYPKDKLFVHQKDNHVVRIETDADYRFDREGRLALRVEPVKLEVASKGFLQGGRIYWRLRPKEDSSIGDTGEIIATLTKPDGSQLIATLSYEILPPREEKAVKVQGQVPSFDIVQINPYVDKDEFTQVWEDLNPDEDDVSKIAYKALPSSHGIIVYYSTAFTPYREQIEKLKHHPSLFSLFEQNYKIWIGYHAIIQFQQRSNGPKLVDLEDEQMDRIQEHERAVVATMQVQQALKIAEMQNQTLKQTATE